MSAATGKEGDEVYILFKYIVRQEIIVITKMKKKMKKLIYFVAAFAAVATFYSCSSDDVLDDIQQPSDVEEVQGKPLTVRVNGEALTRGEYASAITGFKMTGLANGNYGTEWFKDGAFTKDGSWTNNLAADKKSWPSTTAKYDFFAASEDGAAASVSTSTLTDGKISFDYTVPTDLASQKDLLVATNIGAASTDNDGEVSLNFQHALSKVKILGRIAATDYNGTMWDQNTGIASTATGVTKVMYINSVKLYGVKGTGKFTFGNETSTSTKGATNAGSWSDLSGALVFEKEFDTPLMLTISKNDKIANENDAKDFKHVDLLGGEMLTIPQTLTGWTPGAIPAVDGTVAYLAINAVIYNGFIAPDEIDSYLAGILDEDYGGDATDEDYLAEKARVEAFRETGGPEDETSRSLMPGTYYLPLSIDFKANKTHVLRVRMHNLLKVNGDAAIQGAQLDQ